MEELKKIIKGQRAITNDIARKFEVILGIPSNFWLNRKNTYRRELSEMHKKKLLESQKKQRSLKQHLIQKHPSFISFGGMPFGHNRYRSQRHFYLACFYLFFQ